MTRLIGPLLCTAVLAMNASAIAAAEPVPPARERALLRFKHELEKVNLTAEQKQKIQSIFDADKKEQDAFDEKLHAGFKELHGLLEKETPDEAAVMRQADKIGEIRTAQQKARLKAMLQAQAQLTGEQRAKLHGEHRGAGAQDKTPAAKTPASKKAAPKTPAAG